jgi:hypothetical protein
MVIYPHMFIPTIHARGKEKVLIIVNNFNAQIQVGNFAFGVWH